MDGDNTDILRALFDNSIQVLYSRGFGNIWRDMCLVAPLSPNSPNRVDLQTPCGLVRAGVGGGGVQNTQRANIWSTIYKRDRRYPLFRTAPD